MVLETHMKFLHDSQIFWKKILPQKLGLTKKWAKNKGF